MDFTSKLVPGPALPDGRPPGKCQGTGQADGVIYVTGRSLPDGTQVRPNLERAAMRYLKGHDLEWQAMHPNCRGRCQPYNLGAILSQSHNADADAAILDFCHKTEQSVQWTFFRAETEAIDRAVNATRPEHIARWHVVPSPEEGIWCVFYV